MTVNDKVIKLLTDAAAEFHIKEEAWPWPVTDAVKGENINKVSGIGQLYDIDREALLKYLPKFAKVDTRDYAIIVSGENKGKVVHKQGFVRYDFGNGITTDTTTEFKNEKKEKNPKKKKKFTKGSKLDDVISESIASNSGALKELTKPITVNGKPQDVAFDKMKHISGAPVMKPNINIKDADMLEYDLVGDSYEITGFKNEEQIALEYNDIILNVPEMYKGLPVQSIGVGAFENNKITMVYLSKNVREIKDYAFASNNISVLDFNTGIVRIGKGAFTDNKLPRIDMPNQIEVIGDYSFSDNHLDNVKLPNKIDSIGTYSFANNNIRTLEIPRLVVSIGPSAFAHNNITHINFPKGLVTIGKSAFIGNNLTSLSIPRTVEVVFESAFELNGPENNSEDLKSAKPAGVWHLHEGVWVKKGK